MTTGEIVDRDALPRPGSPDVEQALERERRRMELLASTAEQLLATPDPLGTVNALARKVMEFLDCQVFFNFLADDQSGRLRLNACAGIPEETAREIEWLDYGVAVCGCAARDGCRIVAEHIPTAGDPRTELVKSFGVKAYACHPIKQGDVVLGTLSFGSTERETFTEDELSLMKAVTDQVAIAVVRKRNEEERARMQEELVRSERMRASMAERLYAEIAHRMKNNLMLLTSVLQMQAVSLPLDSPAADAIHDATSRISALSVVHEQLYEGQPDEIELCELLRRVGQISAQALSVTRVQVIVEGEPCYISHKLGSTVAILANELIANAVKYGAPQKDGRLLIRTGLHRAGDELHLTVWNSGNPVPAGLPLPRQPGSGLDLVHGVAVDQLGGALEVRPHEGGTLAEIRLPQTALRATYEASEATTLPARSG